ncbi:MAG: GtrA family protein [Candidatus Lustribacter sp.]|jgi:putative flippase GtrA
MERLTHKRGVRQFLKFGVVGASGFVVNLVVFTLLQRVVPNREAPGWYNVIYSIAFLSGGVSNYFLNRTWTFRSTGHVGREGLSFMAVSVMALIVGLIVSAAVAPLPVPFMGRVFGHGHLTWFVSTVSAIVVNFFVNKYWTFRSAD